MPSRAAFFDLDGTLTTVTSIFRFLAFDLAHRGRPESDYADAMAALAASKARGATREATNRAFYRNFAGRPIAELLAVGERWFHTEQAAGSLWRPEALAALREHQAAGELTVLVSGSFTPCVLPIVRFLGLDLARCTELVVRTGVCTGEVAVPMVGEHKARAVRELARANGLRLADCTGYGDDASDLPVLRLLGKAVVVGDDPLLLANGGRPGWRRLEENRYVITEGLT
ncbi:MAG TPA: HAD-IB family hydrolase [Pseudonocardiaceae bacterium]|jgi:HAD superfamily hydrolase (TIGR01490 family)|nr:HAD-IB family hydrolase [Pseudonocardiaceae bacterium]